MFDQTNWTAGSIPLQSSLVAARYRRFESGSERSEFLRGNWRQAYADGYTMFSRLVDLPIEKETLPSTDIEVFRSKGPPISEVWCVETRDLSLLVEIADHFGFAPEIGNQGDLIQDLKELLGLISKRGSIALTQVDSVFLVFDRVEKSEGLTPAETDQIRAFSRRFFKMDFKSKREEADDARNWRAKAFFTVGGI